MREWGKKEGRGGCGAAGAGSARAPPQGDLEDNRELHVQAAGLPRGPGLSQDVVLTICILSVQLRLRRTYGRGSSTSPRTALRRLRTSRQRSSTSTMRSSTCAGRRTRMARTSVGPRGSRSPQDCTSSAQQSR